MIKADVINTKREAQANPSPTLMAEAEKKQTETRGRRRHAARTSPKDRKGREQEEGRKLGHLPIKYSTCCRATQGKPARGGGERTWGEGTPAHLCTRPRTR